MSSIIQNAILDAVLVALAAADPKAKARVDYALQHAYVLDQLIELEKNPRNAQALTGWLFGHIGQVWAVVCGRAEIVQKVSAAPPRTDTQIGPSGAAAQQVQHRVPAPPPAGRPGGRGGSIPPRSMGVVSARRPPAAAPPPAAPKANPSAPMRSPETIIAVVDPSKHLVHGKPFDPRSPQGCK